MKHLRQIVIIYFMISILVIVFANGIYGKVQNQQSEQLYKVELNRLYQTIESVGYETAIQERYQTLSDIDCLHGTDSETRIQEFYVGTEESYAYEAVRDAGGELLVIKVRFREEVSNQNGQIVMNVLLVIGSFMTFLLLLYLKEQIIKPFHMIAELPFELAKGNLVVPLKENRYRYFGRFLWGLDMLREKLEEDKRERLELEREKKLLILSISHDINTPVSSICMAAKALHEDLYEEPEKKKLLADMIGKNAKKIEDYVSQIKLASKEDFLNFTIELSEFYLKDLMDKIYLLYRERCEQTMTEFTVNEYSNQLISGDFDRCVEVLQNIIDNALKYGDGRYIRITFSREEDYRLIHVVNSGNSLKEQEIVHIFESFYRGSNTENKKGSGLGLYICKQLMHQMDGDVYANIHQQEFEVTVVMKIT